LNFSKGTIEGKDWSKGNKEVLSIEQREREYREGDDFVDF
jgi:hypothetical protein